MIGTVTRGGAVVVVVGGVVGLGLGLVVGALGGWGGRPSLGADSPLLSPGTATPGRVVEPSTGSGAFGSPPGARPSVSPIICAITSAPYVVGCTSSFDSTAGTRRV